jgi:hypothetical protein
MDFPGAAFTGTLVVAKAISVEPSAKADSPTKP